MREFLKSVVSDAMCELSEESRGLILEALAMDDWEAALHALLLKDQPYRTRLRECCRNYALRFAEAELSKLTERKRCGTLTPDDMAFARDELQCLLDSVENMCRDGIDRAMHGDNS